MVIREVWHAKNGSFRHVSFVAIHAYLWCDARKPLARLVMNFLSGAKPFVTFFSITSQAQGLSQTGVYISIHGFLFLSESIVYGGMALVSLHAMFHTWCGMFIFGHGPPQLCFTYGCGISFGHGPVINYPSFVCVL